MSTTSARAGFTKAAPEEDYDVGVVNANLDLIDRAVGAVRCTSTTRPSQPFDGQMVRETDTGRIMWYDAVVSPPGWRKAASDVETTTSTNRPVGALLRLDRIWVETDTRRQIWWDNTRWRYLGDRLVVATLAERDGIVGPYAGLSVYRSDMKRTETYDGASWIQERGIVMQVYGITSGQAWNDAIVGAWETNPRVARVPGCWDKAKNAFIVPWAGEWRIRAKLFGTGGTDNQVIIARLTKNKNVNGVSGDPAISSDTDRISGETVIKTEFEGPLAAGDEIRVMVWCGAAALPSLVGSRFGARPYMVAEYLGPNPQSGA